MKRLFVLFLVSCSSPPGTNSASSDLITADGGTVQLNDVSILFPLATTQDDIDNGYLKASDTGVGGALIPKDLFVAQSGFPATPPAHTPVGGDATIAYSTMRVVAMRVDPCFAQIGPVTDASACSNQLRLVFESPNLAGGKVTALDSAVHAFYSLSRDQLTQLLAGLIVARRTAQGDQDLGALAVHPIVAQQGLQGAYAKAVRQLITSFAGTATLSRFTALRSGNLQTVWTFNGFDIANGAATPMVIPTLPSGATSVQFFVGFAAGFAGGFTPSTTSSDNMQLLGNTANAKAAATADQQAALDAVFRIENPGMSSPNTIDCASCHMADPAKIATAKTQLGMSLDDAYAYQSTLDLTQTTPVDPTERVNLHMFSYRDGEAMIMSRVINETANVVAYVNSNITF